MPVFQIFSPLITHRHAARLAHRAGLHERGVAAVVGLGDAEREVTPVRRQIVELLLALLRAP